MVQLGLKRWVEAEVKINQEGFEESVLEIHQVVFT